MKKHLSLLLFPLLLLTSCGSFNEKEFIDGALEEIKTFEAVSSSTYTVEPKGHVIKFDSFVKWEGITFDVPTGEVTYNEETQETKIDLGKSFAIGLPLRLNEKNFYPTKEGEADTPYAYGRFKYLLAYRSDPIHYMKYKTNEDSLIFYIEEVSKPLEMNNVFVPNGPTNPRPVKVNGRFNIEARYNHQGLLTYESIKTINAGKDPDERTVDYSVTYTYNA